MKIIFMGTPDFSVPTLAALVEAGHEIALVITQPDRPAGRGGHLKACPVKEWAVSHSLPVFQPEKIRAEEALERIRAEHADIGVVVAFGQILPEALLTMMPYGCVNVHASLLPKYRGAAPIQFAILDGEPVTGVTTMQMGAGLDDGPILLQDEMPIAPEETGESLFDRLSVSGAALCVKTLSLLAEGKITPQPQDESKATKVGRITKDMGDLDFAQPAVVLERRVRGLYPWPGAFTHRQGALLKVLSAEALSQDGQPQLACGEVFTGCKDAIDVQTADGILRILRVQPQGGRAMAAKDYLLGHAFSEGECLG